MCVPSAISSSIATHPHGPNSVCLLLLGATHLKLAPRSQLPIAGSPGMKHGGGLQAEEERGCARCVVAASHGSPGIKHGGGREAKPIAQGAMRTPSSELDSGEATTGSYGLGPLPLPLWFEPFIDRAAQQNGECGDQEHDGSGA